MSEFFIFDQKGEREGRRGRGRKGKEGGKKGKGREAGNIMKWEGRGAGGHWPPHDLFARCP